MRTLIGHRSGYRSYLTSRIRRQLTGPFGEQIICRNRSRKLIKSNDDVEANCGEIRTDRTPCHLRIIGSGAEGAPKSILFSTRKNSYIFNVGEGIQRIVQEHNIPVQKMKHIFCTYSNWENIGGFIGFLLSMQSVLIDNITIHAPVDLKSFCDMSGFFANFHCLKIQTEVCTKIKYFTDQSLSVQYVTLNANEPLRSAFIEPKSSPKNNENDDAELSVENLSIKTEAAQTAVAFICRTTSKPPILNLEKCVDKGVPSGPLLVELSKGNDVILPNGTTVIAKEVMNEGMPAAVFIVVECPTLDFLDSLANEESFKTYQENDIGDEKYIPQYVIHFTSSVVIEDQRYQNWMKKFSIKTHHVNVNDRNKCTGCVGLHELQHVLHSLDPELYPLLQDDSIPIIHYDLADLVCSRVGQKTFPGLKETDVFIPWEKLNLPNDAGNTLRMLKLRDSNEVETVKECLHINPDHFIEKLAPDRNLSEKFYSIKMQITRQWKQNATVNSADQYPIVTFLGTGSAFAAKFRNVSGILVSLDHHNHMILDCGEGTYGQLVRHFGVERATEIISDTKLIFISHIHTDHHLGLITLLKKRRKAMRKLGKQFEKVYSFVPATLIPWLRDYHQYFEDILDDLITVSNHNLEHRNYRQHYWRKKVEQITGLADIKTAYVLHCHLSFGISFTTKNGFKITYSGDTMRSKELVNIGKNSTLLIHEATYQDELLNDARQRLHSTCSEAIDAGNLMKAKYVILTHFSQRYPLIPVLRQGCPENVGIAFDNMRVTMNNLPKLGSLYPVFRLLFDVNLKKNSVKMTHLNKGLNPNDED